MAGEREFRFGSAEGEEFAEPTSCRTNEPASKVGAAATKSEAKSHCALSLDFVQGEFSTRFVGRVREAQGENRNATAEAEGKGKGKGERVSIIKLSADFRPPFSLTRAYNSGGFAWVSTDE